MNMNASFLPFLHTPFIALLGSRLFYFWDDSVLQFGLRVWNLGKDDIDVHVPDARGTLIEITLGVQGRQLFSQGTAYKLVQ